MECKCCGAKNDDNQIKCSYCGVLLQDNVKIENLNVFENKTMVEKINIENKESSLNVKKMDVGNNVTNKKSNNGIFKLFILIILIFAVLFIIFKDNNDNDVLKNEQESVENNFEIPKNYALNSGMVELISNYETVTTTETVINLYDTRNNSHFDIKFEINSDGQLFASCSNDKCEKQIIDLDGEKAKYIGSESNGISDSYYIIVLTQTGNLYSLEYNHSDYIFYDNISIKSKKLETIDNLVGFCLVPVGNLDIRILQIVKDGIGSKSASAYGITNDGKYISLDNEGLYNSKKEVAVNYLSFKYTEDDLYGYSDLAYIYEDASIGYVDVLSSRKKYQQCIFEKTEKYSDNDYATKEDKRTCFSNLINDRSYIVDENNKIIHAQLVFIGEDNVLYFISFDNKIYNLTKEKKDNNYVAKIYNGSIIKSIKEITTMNVWQEESGSFNTITLEYDDGTTEKIETLNGGSRTSQIVYEKEN